MNRIKRLSDILNENIKHEETTIDIELIEGDERGPKKKSEYSVNYQKEFDGELIEIEGTLKPYNSGRNIDYKFEPDEFNDEKSEEYWDEKWEEIQDEILNKFNNM